MKRIIVLGFLCFYGVSLSAMIAPEVKLLTALLSKDKAHLANITETFKTRRIDIDTCMLGGYTGTQLLKESELKDPSLQVYIDDIFTALEAHRSNPPGADELRKLVSFTSGGPYLTQIEDFLKDKRLNIDLIIYDLTAVHPVTIGQRYDSVKNHHAEVKKVVHLERIRDFRYKDDSVEELFELMRAVNDDPSQFTEFVKQYVYMRKKNSGVLDVDSLSVGGSNTFGFELGCLVRSDKKEGALLIAECVQADRSLKLTTLRLLFLEVEKDTKNLTHLMKWFKKFPMAIDCLELNKFGSSFQFLNQLERLLTSSDKTIKEAATSFAELARSYRTDDMSNFRSLLANYQKDKTKLTQVKDWFDNNPFDIDSALHDPTQPFGETLGEAIDARNDDVLSAIFKDKRSHASRFARHPRPSDAELDNLRDLFEATIGHKSQFEDLLPGYNALLAAHRCVDIDVLETALCSGKTMGARLHEVLEHADYKVGALMLAELMQPQRSDKASTIRALFKAFVKNMNGPKNAEIVAQLTDWFKKFPIDFGKAVYDYSTGETVGVKLDNLMADATTKDAALPIAMLIRPWRSGDLRNFMANVSIYTGDKTHLKAFKEWFDKVPFDIDSAVWQGKTLGQTIDELKDDALSAIFAATRSKAPQKSTNPPKIEPDQRQQKTSYISNRNVALITGVLGTTLILWYLTSKNTQQDHKDTQAITSQ